jgi:hypothetical protein
MRKEIILAITLLLGTRAMANTNDNNDSTIEHNQTKKLEV